MSTQCNKIQSWIVATVMISVGLFGNTPAAIAQDTNGADTLVTVIELPAALDRVLRDYEKGWRAKDEKMLASLFTEDGFIMRPRHSPVRGRANIAESYKGSGGPLYLDGYYYSISEDVGYILGGYRGVENGRNTGKFILTLRKVDDRWYITADMDNGN